MDVLLILASGKASRFGGCPKAFCTVDGSCVAQRTVHLGGSCFDRTYLVLNRETYPAFQDAVRGCRTLAIGTGQGDAHSFLRAARRIREDCGAERITLCWGDTFYLNDTAFRKAASLPGAALADCAGISFASEDPEPYAWYETDGAFIRRSRFRSRDGAVERGIHDQSIFTFRTDIICSQLEQYMTELGLHDEEDYISREVSKEMRLLDAFTYFYENRDRGLLPMKAALLAPGGSWSFNTAEELEELRKKAAEAGADGGGREDVFDPESFRGTYVFDLDGTLWDERADESGRRVGEENMNLFRGIVLSGNSCEHVRDVFRRCYHQDVPVEIYTDFGNVHFTSEDDTTTDVLTEKYRIEEEAAAALADVPAFRGKVHVRGEGCVVTIKPLENREALLKQAQDALSAFGSRYEARISGHTSIDVTVKGYDKKTMLREIMKRHGLKAEDVVYVGNETEEGAEANIRELGVRTLQVDHIYECNALLKRLKLTDDDETFKPAPV